MGACRMTGLLSAFCSSLRPLPNAWPSFPPFAMQELTKLAAAQRRHNFDIKRHDIIELGVAGSLFIAGMRPGTAAPLNDASTARTYANYIRDVDRLGYKIPDFPKRLEWVNSAPLSFSRDIRGKVCLIDFFTYCCANCMHVLPKLKRLEQTWRGKAFQVIGCHSGKFAAEKDSTNIRQAVQRYDIQHPVVNDRDMQYFGALGLSSWPTLVLISPKGTILSILEGEGDEVKLNQLIAAALDFYGHQGLLDKSPVEVPVLPPLRAGYVNSPLRYPGKLHLDPRSARLFVSDSGNHRVLAVDRHNGQILLSVGSADSEAGLVDGTFDSTRFSNPQGLCLDRRGARLYVCDTDNHAIRVIDLEARRVSTLAGNGQQGYDYTGGRAGQDQALSTPWDIVFSDLPGSSEPQLLVAMAGIHQIWQVDPSSGTAGCYSGTGREMLLNARGRLDCAWAQPSGLCVDNSAAPPALYVADSESSAVRELLLEGSGSSQTLVGGSGQPQNLFAFGDRDGSGTNAKLQHPLGVALTKGGLVVADSYNHRIKCVSAGRKSVRSIAGNGKPGLQDGQGSSSAFWEPGGLAADPLGTLVYVADTNNNVLRVVDLDRDQVSTLSITSSPAPPRRPSSIVNRRRANRLSLGSLGRQAIIRLEIRLPEGAHFTAERVSEWQLVDPAGLLTEQEQIKGRIEVRGQSGSCNVSIPIQAQTDGPVEIESAVYYCADQGGVCLADYLILQASIKTGGVAQATAIQAPSPKRTTIAPSAPNLVN